MAVNKDSLKPSCEDSYSDNTVLSLVDVLEENEQLESDACAVLGASDPERCSYPEGYVKRQALYSCSTCNPRGGEAAGVCLACSYKCHEGHDLFELYTKRNFRCDCGNSKFNGLECKLFKEKEEVNATNKYNHNFFGLYCTCERPYPDPEDDTPDEMIQCVVCEDWFHGRHLGALPADSADFQEMVCQECMERCSFLWAYTAQLAVPTVTKVTPLEDSLTDDVDVGDNEPGKNIKQENSASPGQSSHETKSAVPITSIKTDGTTFKEKEGNGDIKGEPCTSTTSCLQSQPQTLVNGDVNCVKKDDTATNSDVQDCLSSCKLHELKAQTVALEKTATYWYQSWRSKLCTCQDCKKMYADLGVSFLLDETDTVQAYEHRGKTNEEEEGRRDPLMAALSNMNRVQQVELIYEYNDLKSELKDYLKQFADEGKVVTSEDIQHFFEGLRSRKRRRLDGMQYYCS